MYKCLKVYNKLCGRPPQYVPAPCKFTSDLLTLKVVSESRVTWTTSVPILVFLGLSVLDLDLMYATDRRQTSDTHHRLMPPPYGGRGHNNIHLANFISTGPTSCRLAAATICPRPSPPPWAPKRRARPSRRQRKSSFPRPTRTHRCSCLTRHHGGE